MMLRLVIHRRVGQREAQDSNKDFGLGGDGSPFSLGVVADDRPCLGLHPCSFCQRGF